MGKLFGQVKAGDTIKVGGERLKVIKVRHEHGKVRVIAEGKTIRIQESFDPGERAR